MAKNRTLSWLRRLLILAVLLGGLGYGGWYYQQMQAGEGQRYQVTTVTRGDLTQVITATGQLNPVVKVEVGSQISGMIKDLLVDFNSIVKKGEIVAQIDPATYEANLLQSEGNLSNAKAARELSRTSAERVKSLNASTLVSQAEYDKAMAELQQAEANVRINEATLKRAQVDLQRCTIRAPIDGVVISRNVNVGQTVAASLSAPTLFLIVNDLSKMQIEANVAEADIGRVKLGQDAEFTVDAFPSQTFRGKVSQIRNAPIIEQNVVTYGTIIEVQNPKLELKPGMTANVSIIVAHRDDTLKLANAALRFRPPVTEESKVEAPAAKSPKKSGSSGKKKDKQKSERTVYIQIQSTGSSTSNAPAAVVLQPVLIKTGITDGSSIEVIDGLKEGDEVVTGVTVAVAGNTMSQASKLLTGQKKKKN